MINRNVSPKTTIATKLCLYKSVILPTIGFGLACWRDSKRSSGLLENFQKHFFKLISIRFSTDYKVRLIHLGLPPLPLFTQLSPIAIKKSQGFRVLNRLKPALEKRTREDKRQDFPHTYFKSQFDRFKIVWRGN